MSATGSLDRATRRARGAWATPSWLVEHLLGRVVDPVLDGQPRRVLDPACGDGRFLAAVRRRAIDRLGVTASNTIELVGVELDPATAAEARRRLGPGTTVVTGDALTLDLGPPFDVVVGNPPFVGQLARHRTRVGRPAGGGGPYADVAVEFLSLAVSRARPDGGHVGLVLPQSVLATRDAAPVRRRIVEEAALDGLWWAGTPVFDAAVHVIALSLVRGAAQGPVARWVGPAGDALPPLTTPDLDRPTWAHLAAGAAGIPAVPPLATSGLLGEVATATAGFRDQFYGLVPYVAEADGDEADAPLVTSGLIDAGASAWGTRPARFAGRRFLRPTVDRAALAAGTPALSAWVEARRRPKVLVATQTPVLEAAVDRRGRWVPSVPVISLEPHPGRDPGAVAAALLSPALNALAATTYLGAGLGATALKLSASQLLTLPLPAGSLDEAVAALGRGDLQAAAQAADHAYGVDDEALRAWWWGRLSRRGRRTPTTSTTPPATGC